MNLVVFLRGAPKCPEKFSGDLSVMSSIGHSTSTLIEITVVDIFLFSVKLLNMETSLSRRGWSCQNNKYKPEINYSTKYSIVYSVACRHFRQNLRIFLTKSFWLYKHMILLSSSGKM